MWSAENIYGAANTGKYAFWAGCQQRPVVCSWMLVAVGGVCDHGTGQGVKKLVELPVERPDHKVRVKPATQIYTYIARLFAYFDLQARSEIYRRAAAWQRSSSRSFPSTGMQSSCAPLQAETMAERLRRETIKDRQPLQIKGQV